MRTHLPTMTTAARRLPQRAAWRSHWLEFSALVLITGVLVDCLTRPWNQPPMLDPLLAVPPALAGIGAATVRRPVTYGALSLLAAIAVAAKPTEFAGWMPLATIFTVVVITAVATVGTVISVRQEQRIAEVSSVAEAAQRAVLRPPPPRLGPLGFDVAYVAAAAEAKVGGDLYEAVATREHGIRVIMGDVRGKGLGAVELAADVLGMFREQAHEACTLAGLAARLDTGLGRELAHQSAARKQDQRNPGGAGADSSQGSRGARNPATQTLQHAPWPVSRPLRAQAHGLPHAIRPGRANQRAARAKEARTGRSFCCVFLFACPVAA